MYRDCKKIAGMMILLTAIFIFSIHPAMSICGDKICEKGYEKDLILITDKGSPFNYSLLIGQTLKYESNSSPSSFIIQLIEINKNDSISKFDIDGDIINISQDVYFNLSDNLTFKVDSIIIGIDSEEVICQQDCNECNTSIECDDKNTCTTDTCGGVPKKCIHSNVSGCTDGSFVNIGENFILGKNACRREYRLVSADTDKNMLIIESVQQTQILNASYEGQPSNQFGFLVHLNEDIFGQAFVYTLRYDENKSRLYTGEANLICPFLDACLSTKDCDDNNLCTIDECDGVPLRCVYSKIAYCKSGDKCCPSKCNYNEDNDCTNPNKCETNSDCNDNSTCTLDLCTGSPKSCSNPPISECKTGDSCCPSGCEYSLDNDCTRQIACGDKICEGNESITCCTDCGCKNGLECSNNICTKPFLMQAQEFLSSSQNLTKMKNELLAKKFKLNNTITSINAKGGMDFSFIFTKGIDHAFINGTISKDLVLQAEFLSPSKANISYFYFIGIIIAVALVGGTAGIAVHRKIKAKKKEEYYKKLLLQKFTTQRQSYPPQFRNPQVHQAHYYPPRQYHPIARAIPPQQQRPVPRAYQRPPQQPQQYQYKR